MSAAGLYALGVKAGYHESWWQAAAVPVVADEWPSAACSGSSPALPPQRQGAGYGWLLVGCGTPSIGSNIARPTTWSPREIAAAIPLAVLAMLEGLKGDASESPASPAQTSPAHRDARPAGQPPPATTLRRADTGDAGRRGRGRWPTAASVVRRANPTDRRVVGTRLQKAYDQQRPDGRPWTARTLAQAAGCGAAPPFLQRQRPPAAERTA